MNILDKVKLKESIYNTEANTSAKYGTIKEIYNIENTNVVRVIVYFNDADREYMFESNGQNGIFNTSNLTLI